MGDHREASKAASKYIDVYGEISKIIERNIYQCPDCGRLYVEVNPGILNLRVSGGRRKSRGSRMQITGY